MNKFFLALSGLLMVGSAFATPQALYVMKDGACSKYNFGVAGDLHFTDNGHKLRISGYNDIINLDNIDYITFNAPVGATGLTSYEQKRKMIEIGEAVNALVDQKNVEGIIRMLDAFLSDHEINDKYFHAPCTYDLPEEYRNEDEWVSAGPVESPNVMESFKALMTATQSLAKGDVAAIRTICNKAREVYRLSDYYGIYTAYNTTEEWVKTDIKDAQGYFEIRFLGFDNVYYTMRMDCDPMTGQFSVDDYTVELPEKMTFVFKADGLTVAKVEMNTTLVQNEHILLDINAEMGKYKVTDTIDITNPLISEIIKVFVDGKQSISTNARIYGANLVNYDVLKDDIKEATHYHDEDGNCCGDDPQALVSHVYRAVTDVDVLGMLQVRSKALGFSQLCDILSEDQEDSYGTGLDNYTLNSDRSSLTYSYTTKEEIKQLDRITNHLNTYWDAQFFYDGKKELQGFLSFEVTDEPYNHYNSLWIVINNRLYSVYEDSYSEDAPFYYTYLNGEPVKVASKDVFMPAKTVALDYVIAPRLTFPDMTSYAYEDFFNEISFKKLITDYKEILDTYNALTGHK